MALRLDGAPLISDSLIPTGFLNAFSEYRSALFKVYSHRTARKGHPKNIRVINDDKALVRFCGVSPFFAGLS